LGAEVSIDWGDLDGVRFSEPFFDQTIERWAGGPAPRLIRTGLEALDTHELVPSLDPTALIFHLSRCGSTLMSRLLAVQAETLVISRQKRCSAFPRQATPASIPSNSARERSQPCWWAPAGPMKPGAAGRLSRAPGCDLAARGALCRGRAR
jgi:hypothetical protein